MKCQPTIVAFTLAIAASLSSTAGAYRAAAHGSEVPPAAESSQATPAVVPTSPGDAQLASRVDAYWKRRQARDLAGAYPFYCSAYKARVPKEEFLKLTRLTRFELRDVRVVRMTEAGNKVQVTVSYRFLMPTISSEPIAADTTESWVRDVDQEWCKEDEPLVLPFPKLDSLFSSHP